MTNKDDKAIKVLIVSSLPLSYSCGVKTHLRYLTQALDTMKIHYNMLHLNDGNIIGKVRSLRSAVNFNRSGLFNLWAQNKKISLLRNLLRHTLESDSFNLIHAHDVYAGIAALHENNLNIPILFTMHGPMSYEMLAVGEKKNSLRINKVRYYENMVYHGAKACLAVDSGQKKILVEDYFVPDKQVFVVPNAIDIEEVLRLSTNYKIPNLPTSYFLVPRRLVPKNGVQFAIEALRYARKQHNLVIAGTGPQTDFLKGLAAQGGYNDRVFFLGDLAANVLMPIMSNSKGVIVPSIPVEGVIEATSLAVLEAMALHRPLIVSKLGGIWEILQSENLAYWIKPGDPYTIAQALDHIVDAREADMKKMTNACFDILELNHSLGVWGQRIASIYDKCIASDQLSEN